jgi:hypothetical protein
LALLDFLVKVSHSHFMRSAALVTEGSWRRQRYLGVLTLATSGALMIGATGGVASAESAHHSRFDLSNTHKHQPKHQGKPKSSGHPCLVGKWVVTSLTLSTTGLTFTGGVGTTVDILSNGNALGDFTPGTPLTGTEGSAKFNGTITDHYGFSPKTTAHSGTFSSVTSVTDNGTITVGGLTRAVSPSPEQGSYTCTGKDLSLVFTSGGNTLTYKLKPAG